METKDNMIMETWRWENRWERWVKVEGKRLIETMESRDCEPSLPLNLGKKRNEITFFNSTTANRWTLAHSELRVKKLNAQRDVWWPSSRTQDSFSVSLASWLENAPLGNIALFSEVNIPAVARTLTEHNPLKLLWNTKQKQFGPVENTLVLLVDWR